MSSSIFHFCTYFDINYLSRGLAMYDSLRRHCRRPFVLWILCFDDASYNLLSGLALADVKLIKQIEFERGDAALVATKSDRSHVEYYWTCTPSLPRYVLAHNAEVETITYLDADLYFYSDPQPIFDELNDDSILIIEHRYAREFAHLAKTSGIYNVGWLSFRRDVNGLACLEWWRERCIEWCHAWYEEGKFGDQLYLDEWPTRFQGVVVLQNKGGGLAPWNLAQYTVRAANDGISIDEDELIFFHFHGFRRVHRHVAQPANMVYYPMLAAIRHIILPYANELQKIAVQTGMDTVDGDTELAMRDLVSGVMHQKYLLIRPAFGARTLWRLAGRRRAAETLIERGFVEYHDGKLSLMRRHFLRGLLSYPPLLFRRGILSSIVRSFVSPDLGK